MAQETAGKSAMSDRDQAIAKAVAKIEKDHGKGSIMKMSTGTIQKIGVIPTGSISLDVATGIGGIARGRVTEIYGPESSGKTTLCLHVVANAQKRGGIAAYIDAEHALDTAYAERLGVDVDNLLVSQPDTGEQALAILEELVRSAAVDVVVIDSVAALVPKAEIEGDMGDSHMGLQARLMSQALRKITGAVAQTKTSVIFINQLRDKIGVMFGCMSYNTRVQLADGTSEKIGKIVNQRMPVEVLSYDSKKKAVSTRAITDWHNNGPTDRFLSIAVAKPSGNGRSSFKCTPNHHVRTPEGWTAAESLKPGDLVMQQDTDKLSKQQKEIIRGSLMGDGCLSTQNNLSAAFRIGHGAKQTPYCLWKAGQLGNVARSQYKNSTGGINVDFESLRELGAWREEIYTPEGKNFSKKYLQALTPLALAIWYQDDAGFSLRSKGVQKRTRGGSGRVSICVEAMTPKTRERVAEVLASKFLLECKTDSLGGKAVLVFDRKNTDKLQKIVAPFIIPEMQFKLTPRFKGRYKEIVPSFAKPKIVLYPAPVTSVRSEAQKNRQPNRFDISIDGTHNYFVDGVMVHNSPETTTGGKALKFYASMRLDIRRIGPIKDKDEIVGNATRVKVVKNKLAAPFKQAEFEILYAKGIDNTGFVLDQAVEMDLVKKSGAFYTYKNERLAQGRENAKAMLDGRADLLSELTILVTDHLMGHKPPENDEGDDTADATE